MKRTFLLLGSAVLLAGLCSAALAALPNPGPDKVAVGDFIKVFDSYGNTSGGEFLVNNVTKPLNAAFETFCVQAQETLSFNTSYKVFNISTTVISAGGGPLSFKTAFVFAQFRAGTLAGYQYNGTNAQRAADADDLQKLIWSYEGEAGGAIVGKGVGWDATVTAANPTTWGNVRVINLGDKGLNQDLLTIIPEPVFFQMGALLGMGGLALARNRRKV